MCLSCLLLQAGRSLQAGSFWKEETRSKRKDPLEPSTFEYDSERLERVFLLSVSYSFYLPKIGLGGLGGGRRNKGTIVYDNE